MATFGHEAAAAAAGGGGDSDVAGVHILESSVDFMSLFYCHLTVCPPHGPFVYYTAMTLVRRAMQRYGAGGGASSPGSDASADVYSSNGSWSSDVMGTGGAAAVLRALTIPNVIALIEKRYDTSHLASWPLLYVPAEIRAADVDALMQRQLQQGM
ncbi:hypothetical protein JKF63_05321 [Porcisia hertigi]|uniref:Uncharacterized protein n=1 Tax=Porcisia hertigi TaxID=2761500 RepID=A0A836LE88_9TRYP|nr:hypothetical protein JKF63_05321 [Porcisia hertigi]